MKPALALLAGLTLLALAAHAHLALHAIGHFLQLLSHLGFAP